NDHAGAQAGNKRNRRLEPLTVMILRQLLSDGFLDDRADLVSDTRLQPCLLIRWCCGDIHVCYHSEHLLCSIDTETCDATGHILGSFANRMTEEAQQACDVLAPRMAADLATKIADRTVDDQIGPQPLDRVTRIDVVNTAHDHIWIG